MSLGWQLRQLTAADAQAFSRLRREVTAHDPVAMGLTLAEELTRPIEKFREQLSFAAPNAVFGAFVAGELVGTAAVAWPSRLPSSRHKVNLWGVFVSPRFRGRGIARALVERAIDHARCDGAKRVNLTVFVPNAVAVRLYKSLGFEHVGTEPQAICIAGVYHDGYLMSRGRDLA
jgi:RimJ/RimL family protein N-acetyltransferase